MISIVLVSHSRKVAEGVLDLLRQVIPPGAQIRQAAGAGPDYSEIGTDAVHIAEVLESVFSQDGVLVLMDLGSAVLSAEMALELLPEEKQSRVCLCPAPFVEGALAAGALAGFENDLKTICRESQKALEAKLSQLSNSIINPSEQAAAHPIALDIEIQKLSITIRNPHGLHLRPAARFVQTAARFKAEISVWNQSSGNGPVPAKSINGLAMLNLRQGDEIKIVASGLDSKAAILALGDLIRQNFGEGLEEPPTAPAIGNPMPGQDVASGKLIGISIATGVAIAPLYHLKQEITAVEGGRAGDSEAEWVRLEQALQRVKENLQKRQATLQQRLGNGKAARYSAEILDAHRVLLEDPELIQNVRRRIYQDGSNSESAWMSEIRQLRDRYHELSDSYLKQRGADVAYVGNQVLAELAGKSTTLEIPGAGQVILYTEELTPAETAQLNLDRVAGLLTTSGAVTSHSAILARALGIPGVTGIALSTEISDGTLIVLDGDQGQVLIDPPEDVQARYEGRKQLWAAQYKAQLANCRKPAVLKNGRQVAVMANIGSLDDAKLAINQGAEGVGLLRTEFLFLSRTQEPNEEEQVSALRAIGQAMEGRPVIVRTLDVGGDKHIPYLTLPDEANPFLGIRAIRLSLRHPALFQTQLRAILRAASDFPYRVMFPMIANLVDLQQATEQLNIAHTTLSEKDIPHRWPVETGIMVEIPSAALLSDRFAPLVDFFSIGTNDLTQYTFAADRGNPSLAEYADSLHPAILNLVQQVVKSAKRYGKPVGICGELAGDPQAAPVLIGLGLEEFSMNPAVIPGIKETIRQLDEDSAILLAQRVLQMDSAAEVRREAQNYLMALG